MSRRSRSRSRARPASVVPSGTWGAGASIATPGSQSKSVRMRSTDRLEPHAVLGLLHLAPLLTLPDAGEHVLLGVTLVAQGLELAARLARPLGLDATLLAEPPEHGVDPAGQLVEAATDREVGLALGEQRGCGSAPPPPSPPDRGRDGPRPRRGGGSGSCGARRSRRPAPSARAAAGGSPPRARRGRRAPLLAPRPVGPPRPRLRRAPARAPRARRCGPAPRPARRRARSGSRR